MSKWALGFFVLLIGGPAGGQGKGNVGRTTGQLPFMEYGIGDDRLGGAKIGYLDSNILVRIIDSFSSDYKVRLSAYHSAYIAKSSLALAGREVNRAGPHNPHLSGDVKVFC